MLLQDTVFDAISPSKEYYFGIFIEINLKCVSINCWNIHEVYRNYFSLKKHIFCLELS